MFTIVRKFSESWTCIKPDMRWNCKRTSRLLASANWLQSCNEWRCFLPMGGQRKTSADLPVKVPAGNSIDLVQSECRPLRFLRCTNDTVWPILKKKTSKKFPDDIDLTAKIDKDCRSEQSNLKFSKNLSRSWIYFYHSVLFYTYQKLDMLIGNWLKNGYSSCSWVGKPTNLRLTLFQIV